MNLGAALAIGDPVGAQLRAAMKSPAAFALLDAHNLGDDWGAGGCAVLATALLQLLPGAQLRAIVANGMPQHYVVEWRGRIYDYDGSATESSFRRRWQREHPHMRGVRLERASRAGSRDIACPAAAVRMTVAFLRERLSSLR